MPRSTSHRHIDMSWIDQACIDQANPGKKPEAISSMDLVYQNATQSVGLLSTPICTCTGARLLTSLLKGNLSFEDRLGDFHFYHKVRTKRISEMIHNLETLVGDCWWSKAWIYQEEYISGSQMDLLIPVRSGVRVPDHYGVIAEESCV